MSSTTGKITVEVIPPNPVEGMDVVLFVHNLTRGASLHFWYKGDHSVSRRLIASYDKKKKAAYPGPAYSVRETVYDNGTLLIQNVTRMDTGVYSFHVIKIFHQTEEVTAELRVLCE